MFQGYSLSFFLKYVFEIAAIFVWKQVKTVIKVLHFQFYVFEGESIAHISHLIAFGINDLV